MKFPKVIHHRKAEVTIYGKKESYPFYRLCWRFNGRRQMQSFATYGEAKAAGDKKVRELANGSQSLALTAKEVTGALAIRDTLDAFRRETGRTITALQAVTQYVHAAKLLGERPLDEAVESYLRTVAVVRRKALSEAVTEFVAMRAPKAEAKDGKRSTLNPKYIANTANWLQKFAKSFPGNDVCDLSKDHLNAYIAAYSELSAKSRNDRRAVVKQFLKWSARNDYLTASHRLLEADGLAKEASDAAPIEYYGPGDLRKLLDKAEGQMRAVIALQALAGLRLEEVLRLDWRDVFGIPGHIEISSSKSKTRQRRLVVVCPALKRWLATYRGIDGKVATQWQTVNGYVQAFIALREELKIASRRNGLRHGFVTFHFALHQNENLTAAVAGNSPAMIHAHYKGLATKAEARKWFSVRPAKATTNVVHFPKQAGA
jgi:integrase